MTDKTEAMDNLIAQDADLIEICPDDLVRRLRRTYRKEFAATGSMFADISNRLRPFPILATEVLFNPDGREAADRIEAQAAEIERLRGALKDAHWYYLGDDCSSDQCRFGIDECISEDFEWDNPPMGDHVLQISGARPVPDMWVALHYFSDEEKDERDDDEAYSYTVHATEEEARAALAGKAEQ